ncbi:MAG TPA: hypothetical protein VFE52_02065 [Devosia sp.]|jgi:hypothetical protein|nr:hypothetical protein [Devosia sp.]
MALTLIKTGAIAATALILSASGALAATYGSINYDTKVREYWTTKSDTVSYVDEGDYVKIIDFTKKNGGWFRIDPPGPNNAGWVKKSAVDLDIYEDEDDYNNGPGVEFCFTGPLGHICVND